jgi:hypothetical protein
MLRNTVLGLAAVFGVSVWAWSRPAEVEARAPGVGVVAADSAARPGGTFDQAASQFRTNQAGHWWRQVVIRR